MIFLFTVAFYGQGVKQVQKKVDAIVTVLAFNFDAIQAVSNSGTSRHTYIFKKNGISYY